MQAFYGGKTSSDLRLNPHLHVVFLDGSYQGGTVDEELVWREHGHLQTRDVGRVLERALRRMARWLRRRGTLPDGGENGDDGDDGDAKLVASAVSGQAPPAGPQWGLPPLDPRALEYDKPLRF